MYKTEIPKRLRELRGEFVDVDNDFIYGHEDLYESIDNESHDEFIRRENEED